MTPHQILLYAEIIEAICDARDLHATLSEVLMTVDRTDPCEHDESEAGLCVFCRAREVLERCDVYTAVPA